MGASQQDAILFWIDGVSRSLQETPLDADRLKESVGDPTTPPPSTPRGQHKRKRADSELESSMPQRDPSKRAREADATSASLGSASLRLGDDTSSLPPSSSAASRSGRSRSSSPNRVKRELRSATPKIIYLDDLDDPGSPAAKELLTTLTEDAEIVGNQQAIQAVYTASRKHMKASAPESYWVMDVAVPLLKTAIDDLPLEYFTVQTDSVDLQYQPRYTNRDGWHRKIDLAIGLPFDSWEAEYSAAGFSDQQRAFNHVVNQFTSRSVLGPGLEIKAADGNLIEAQVQLGVWMAGLLMWASQQRKGTELPPLVGCTAVGQDWKFYIIIGVNGPSGLEEIRVWGPHLDGSTRNEKTTTSLFSTLRRVMKYTSDHYGKQIFQVITPHV